MAFGILFVFFYQILVEYDFLKVNFRINLAEQLINKEFFLLAGWSREKKANEESIIWSEGRSSTIALFFPKKSAYQIKLKLLFSKEGLVEVYVNKKLVKTLESIKTDKWQDFQFIVPRNLISKGFNKIGFANLSKSKVPVGYNDLEITNYQRMPLAFPSGYILFDKARWLSRGEGWSVNWLSCIFGGLILLIVWVIYSIWFFSLSEIEFPKVLRFDFFTYLPSISILLAIYLFSRIFLYSPVFTRKDFLLFSTGLIGCVKVYQFYKYVQMHKIKVQIDFLKEIMIAHITGSIFIIGFMVLLVICTFSLIIKQENVAEKVANWAYLLLVIGVMLRLIQLLLEQRR